MENKQIIDKIVAATAEVNSTGTAMVAIFAEDKVAAREYINGQYRLEKYGTYRFLNKADGVCYDIIGMNDNHRRNYTRAVYFDGKSLKNKNELLAQFATAKVEEAKPAVEAITTATTEAVENLSAAILVYTPEMNAGIKTLEATEEQIKSVKTVTTEAFETITEYIPVYNPEMSVVSLKPTRRRKPTVFEESEPTTDGGNE